ncbi:MAG: adenosine deaminase [Microterricola sp.]
MLINLHTHLEGRIRPATAGELAVDLGLPDARRDWGRALELDVPADLTVYLQKVAASYPFFANAEALRRITREAVEDAAADGEDYLELRFGPATHVRDGFDLDAVIAAVCEGVSDGVAETGMPAGVVVAALRHHDPEVNERVARAAARGAGRGVVGFDLAGDELLYPALLPFVESFAIAGAAGLGLTCHAAEAAPGSAAVAASRLLGVSRIGHGAHIIDDHAALAQVVDAGLAVEVCPSSNVFTGAIDALDAHPAARLRAAGIPVVLGDDNPRQTGSLLSAEDAILRSRLGFDSGDMARLAEDSVRVAFMEDATRKLLRARL